MWFVDPGSERKPTDRLGGELVPKFQTKSSGYFYYLGSFILFMLDICILSLYNTLFGVKIED